MNIRDIASKVKGYIQSKTQDDEGWIRQGKFTPVQEAKSRINYQMQNSPVNRALYTAIGTAGRPVVNSLANIGALGTTALGSAQMAFNRPSSALKSFDTANKLRNFAGTQGSFDQGTGWNTIKKGGLDAVQTALTGKGLKYVTPTNLGLSGLLGGGISKATGGDFATGFGQGMGNTPQIMGFVGATNPLLAKVMPKTAGNITGRLGGAGLNIAQGVGMDIARGTPTTATSVGLDALMGLAGGKGQFETGNIKVKGFSLDNLTKQELIRAEDMLNNPTKYLTDTYNASIKNKGIEQKAQIKKIQTEAFDVIDRLAGKYLPNNVYTKSVGNPKQQIKLLVDLSGQNKLGNIQMGITDNKQPSISTPQNKGNYKWYNSRDMKFEQAEQVKSVPIDNLDTFVHKVDGGWKVTESKSGAAMSEVFKTPQQAIDNATQRLKEFKLAGNDINSQIQKIADSNVTASKWKPEKPQSQISPESKGIPQTIKVKSQNIDEYLDMKRGVQNTNDQTFEKMNSNIVKVKPNDDLVTKFDETIKVGEQPKIKVSPLEMPKPPEIKQRGFSTSVQEAPNVNKQVKQEVLGGYEPKQNDILMGEAKGLLEEGVDVDLRNIKDIDKKVAATMQEAINQQKTNPQLAANLFNNLSEKGTELGRGVQAFALLKRMSPESIALSASGLIKKYNRLNPTRQIPELNGDQVKMISDKVTALDLLKGREKNIALNELNEIINSFIPSKISDKLITIWKAGLLTSLRTHERNFVGNAIHGVMEVAKDIPASITDMGLSKITGQRSKTFTVKGLGEFGSKKTGQQMMDIVKRGFDPTEQINKFDYKKVNWGNNPIEKFFKGYTDIVFRSLGASDKPFYNAALARSLYDQAAVAAINAGKKGNKQFIESLVSKPTEDMLKIAIGDANVSTFKDKNVASKVVNQLKQALGKNEFSKVLGEITMPFTGVPTSILGQIQAYSPVGLVKGIYKVGKVAAGKVPELQRQASEELGRGIIGTGIFGLGAYLAGQGLITGQPKDATEARQWELENKPRNSIMIGGKWRSLNSIGPEAVVFLAGAKLNEELNSGEGNLGTYGLKIGKDYLDQSFVTGLQQPVNALTDPARYGKSYLGNQLSSFTPNIIKDLSKSIDPNAREANTVMDYAKLGTPARLGMIEKRDALGNVIPQEPTGVGAFIDLFNSKTPRSSETIKELSRLYKVGESATPSKLTASQTIIPGKEKVKLTFDQLNSLEKGVGEVLQPQLEKLVTSPVYQKLTDEKKANAISNLVSDVRSKYKLQNANSLTGGKVNINGGYVDKSGSFKEVNTDTIPKPEYTGNATIDKKLKTQYENAIEKQKVDIALSQQNQEVSGLQKEYSYIDEDGNYKSVDLSPVQFPKLTGDTVVDKKLKSSYYSEINAQINNVIKLNKAGEITQDEMIKMVTALDKQYTAGKGSKKAKKIAVKFTKYESPKANIKFTSPRASKFKLSSAPKIKISKTDNRKYTIKA